MGPDGKYGAWIRQHNAVIKINDTLLVHAGLSARHALLSLDELNRQVREGLQGDRAAGLARSSSGPLWYRGLAEKPEDEVAGEVQTILKAHGAKRIVIGHTVSKGAISCRANGQVVMIDVGMTKAFGGTAACLVIEGDNAFAVTENGQAELPSPAMPAARTGDPSPPSSGGRRFIASTR